MGPETSYGTDGLGVSVKRVASWQQSLVVDGLIRVEESLFKIFSSPPASGGDTDFPFMSLESIRIGTCDAPPPKLAPLCRLPVVLALCCFAPSDVHTCSSWTDDFPPPMLAPVPPCPVNFAFEGISTGLWGWERESVDFPPPEL
eukprot:129965-Amorphochlora_amoeboformis.AAC.1